MATVNSDPDENRELPQETIETAAKSMYKQAREYGFKREDIVRFVNVLLDLSFEKSGLYTPPPTQKIPEDSRQEYLVDGSTIRLRAYKDEDFPLLKKWVEDPVGRLFLLTRTRFGEPDTLEDLVKSDNSLFAMVLLDDKPIGALAYLNIDRDQKKAEIRKLIADPEARGKGFATEAVRYWIEYGITNLGLHKIFLNTLENNLANIRLNEQLGFRIEGLLRDESYHDGQYHDILRMSLIVPE